MKFYPNDDSLIGIEDVNQIKDVVQQDVVNVLAKYSHVVAECATGFGKTEIGIKAIRRIRAKTNAPIVVVVPTTFLQKNWIKRTAQFSHIYVYVINSYTNLDNSGLIRSGMLLILDEAQTALNKESENFSKTLSISSFPFKLILSASLEDNHKSFLNICGITNYYEVSLYWCYKNNLIPEYRNVNIPVELTLDEKMLVYNSTNRIDSIRRKFVSNNIDLKSPFNVSDETVKLISNDTGWDVRSINKNLWMWASSINSRKNVYQNAQGKLEMTKLLCDKIGHQKVLLFCSTEPFGKKLMNTLGVDRSQLYTGVLAKSTSDKIIDAFVNNQKPYLISIKKLIAGADFPDCRFAIRTSFSSKSVDAVQSMGRILRFDINNPDKKSLMVNWYVNDFKILKQSIESREKEWLLQNQKGLSNVEWLDSLDDLNFDF